MHSVINATRGYMRVKGVGKITYDCLDLIYVFADVFI